jgi:hypothetical protein
MNIVTVLLLTLSHATMHPHQMRETGRQGGEIGFLQYLASVERTQLAAFLGTNVGKAQLAKKSMGGGHSSSNTNSSSNSRRAKPVSA